MLVFRRSSEFWVSVPARVALPVLKTSKSVVVEFDVDDAIINALTFVSPLSRLIATLPPGS